MNEQYKAEIEREDVEVTYNNAITELGLKGYAHFGGFFDEDSNSRARSIGREIFVNEKYTSIDKLEQQRVAFHECQHVLNGKKYEESDSHNAIALFAFVLHPEFRNLHSRLEKYYLRYLETGYPFGKTVKPLVTKYADIGMANENYTHPDEVLALLRGYMCYLEQLSYNPNIKTEPYEFIDAFLPDDITLLDELRRLQLAKEVVNANPSALDVESTTPLVFEVKKK